MTIRNHRDLRVWQHSVNLVEATYRASCSFPRTELFGLQAQMRRSAVSIPSNIAEGHARESTKDFLRFLSIALGSVGELETQLHIAHRLGYLASAETDRLLADAEEIKKMVHGLRAGLRRRLKGAPIPDLFPNP